MIPHRTTIPPRQRAGLRLPDVLWRIHPLALVLVLVGGIGLIAMTGWLSTPIAWGTLVVDGVLRGIAAQRVRALVGLGALIGLFVLGTSLVAIRRAVAAAHRATYRTAWRAAEQQVHAHVLHEVRMLEHAHLKNAVTEAQVLLGEVARAQESAQRQLWITELDHSLNRLRRVVVELHGRIGDTSATSDDTALPLDLERTLVEVTRNFRTLIPETRLERVGTLRCAVPVRVRAALEMVLYNALSNAHAHGKAQAAWVRIEYQLEHVMLVVRDNGVGFDVTQARKTTRGRGLHDLYASAHTHHGTCAIVSHPGQGTEVCVTLPVERPALGWAAPLAASAPDPMVPPPPARVGAAGVSPSAIPQPPWQTPTDSRRAP